MRLYGATTLTLLDLVDLTTTSSVSASDSTNAYDASTDGSRDSSDVLLDASSKPDSKIAL